MYVGRGETAPPIEKVLSMAPKMLVLLGVKKMDEFDMWDLILATLKVIFIGLFAFLLNFSF